MSHSRATRTARSVGALMVTAAIALCAAAQAIVVPAQSVDGVQLDSTPSQVAAILGTPSSHSSGEYEYDHGAYQVIFMRGRATAITTFGRAQRTAGGLGVGSSLKQVKAGEPGVKCEPSDGELDCYLGSIKRGHRFTDFFFENDKASVTAVTVGLGYL